MAKVKLPKPRLEASTPPRTPNYARQFSLEHSFASFDRCEATGVVVGRRQLKDNSGASHLWALDGEGPARQLHSTAMNLGPPKLCPDGSHVLATTAGPPGVIELPIAGGEPVRIWDGFSPDGYRLGEPVYVGTDRVVFACDMLVWMMRRSAPLMPLEPMTSLEGCHGAFGVRAFDGGRFVLIDHPSKQFVVGVGAEALHLISTVQKSKGAWSVHGDRAFSFDKAKSVHFTIANLDEIHAAL